MAGNRAIQEIIFHKNATTITDGDSYMITSDASTMNIDFIGSGIFSATIQGKVSTLSDWDDILSYDTKTGNLSTVIDNFNTWQIDLTSWSYLRCRLTSVSGIITSVAKLVG